MPRSSQDPQNPTASGGDNASPAAGNPPRKRVFFVKFAAPEQDATPPHNSEPDESPFLEDEDPLAENNETPWFWVSVDTPEQARQIAAGGAGEAENAPERRDLPMPPPRPAEPDPPPAPEQQAPQPPPSPEPPPSTELPPSPALPASSEPQAQQPPQTTEATMPASTWRSKLDRLTGAPKDEEPSAPTPVPVRRKLEWPE